MIIKLPSRFKFAKHLKILDISGKRRGVDGRFEKKMCVIKITQAYAPERTVNLVEDDYLTLKRDSNLELSSWQLYIMFCQSFFGVKEYKL